MKRPNSENISKSKTPEKDEMTTAKEAQKENKKGDEDDESKISLTPSNTSQEQEDNLDSYSKEDSNSNLYNETENFCDNKAKEESNACEKTEIKEGKSLKNDSQQEKIEIIPQNIFLNKKRKKTNVNIDSIKKIIKKETIFLIQKKKQYKKKHFDEILKVNNLDKFVEKIEIALKEEKTQDKDTIYYEEDENFINNDSSGIKFKQDFTYIDINEAINENNTFKMFDKDSTLVGSLFNKNSFLGIPTKTLSTKNDE